MAEVSPEPHETVKLDWNRGPLCSYDCESTGVDVEADRIVTAALITPDGTREWLSDVDGVEIPAGAYEVHKVSTEHARQYGRPAKQVVDEIAEALAGQLLAGVPLVVMNAPFDLSMLDRECRRHGVPTLMDRLDGQPIGPVVDPLVMDRAADRWRKGPRKLEALAALYGVVLTEAHTAGADAEAALDVALRIAEAFPQLQVPGVVLHGWQTGWHRDQAASLETYLRQKDPAATVDRNWPLRPFPTDQEMTR